MAIHIYSKTGGSLGVLTDDDWDLPTQLYKLEKWVLNHRKELTQGPYVADIGFMVREDASGGGAVLSHETMRVFSQVRLSIYFSEYIGAE